MQTLAELARFRDAMDMSGDAIYLVERASMRIVLSSATFRSLSASLDFVPAGLALKRLQFIFAAVDRVWRSPDHMGHSAARQASRPHISAKSDIRKAHPATLTNPN